MKKDERRVFFDIMTREELNKKIAKGKIDIDSIISIQRLNNFDWKLIVYWKG